MNIDEEEFQGLTLRPKDREEFDQAMEDLKKDLSNVFGVAGYDIHIVTRPPAELQITATAKEETEK